MSFQASKRVTVSKTNVSCAALCFAARDVAGAMFRLYTLHPRVHYYMHENIRDLGEGPLFGRGVWTAIHDNCNERSGHGPLQRLMPTGVLKHDAYRLREECTLFFSFWWSTAAVSTDLHGVPRPCPRCSAGNRRHSTGYRGPSTSLHGHFTGFHGMPRQVVKHRGGSWHYPW